ncbi:MAG: hypothetical protein HC767_01885 [Akkermansiaceae bacterium]|nr:hypothetical protein [Akkermansiaceae bacterium]
MLKLVLLGNLFVTSQRKSMLASSFYPRMAGRAFLGFSWAAWRNKSSAIPLAQ